MKFLGVAALLSLLLFCASCHRSDTANPVAPSASPVSPIAGPLSFQTNVEWFIGSGGLRVTFIPNADVTISRVTITPAGSTSIDTVLSSNPSQVFSKGTKYTLDGYNANGWGEEGYSWKFEFTGKVEPADTLYTCASESIVP